MVEILLILRTAMIKTMINHTHHRQEKDIEEDIGEDDVEEEMMEEEMMEC